MTSEGECSPLYTRKEAIHLAVNDKIDHRDYLGRFVYARIIDKNGTELKIHYRGYDDGFDVWDDYGTFIQIKLSIINVFLLLKIYLFLWISMHDF